jgi:hypothetical protein
VLEALCNYFSPFGVMKDVSRGTFAERAAAFRYNCSHRGRLTPYIQRWLVSGAVALVLTAFFDAQTPHESPVLTVPVILAACVAMFASLAACAVFVLSYAYAALSYAAAHPNEGSY